jgi:hypothetical protein
MRGWVGALLAGEIATQILNGCEEGQVFLDWGGNDEPEDCDKAVGICMLLPFRFDKEFDSVTKQTERILRTPEVWQRVLNLANLLEEKGILGREEEAIPFLPKPLRNWPKPPHRQIAEPLMPKLKLAA